MHLICENRPNLRTPSVYFSSCSFVFFVDHSFRGLLSTRLIYQHGNILIDGGRLRMGGESLPLVNIVGASRLKIALPKRNRGMILLVSALAVLAGIHLSASRWGWGIAAAGALLGLWAWFFHRQKAWVVRLHLLLNQRIQILFETLDDAEAFLTALGDAKGGELPVRRST
jgi:hypothetical protein